MHGRSHNLDSGPVFFKLARFSIFFPQNLGSQILREEMMVTVKSGPTVLVATTLL